MRFLDSVLGERRFVAGDRFTMADIFAFGALDYGIRFVDFELPPERKNLGTWFAAVASRPSAKA